MTLIELKRLFGEWRTRMERVQQVLQPPKWTPHDWQHFAQALYMLVKKYGSSWEANGTNFWDIRWGLREGGELICQVEERPSEKHFALIVAQTGGFASGVDSYTWFYGEFNESWQFIGNPYWVDGNWKDALAMILLPHQMAAGFYLTSSSAPLQNFMLTNGNAQASPNTAAAQ